MYTSFDKKNKLVGLWKSKAYMPNKDVELLNSNLAKDYHQFWMTDIHKSGYLEENVLEPLKKMLEDLECPIYKTLRIADSFTTIQRDMHYNLKYYSVKVLFTYEGDRRPIEKIIETLKNTPEDWYSGGTIKMDTFTRKFNVDNYTEADYMTTLNVPYVTDNCTFVYDNIIAHDNGELKERYFKLQIRQKPGIYVRYKKSGTILNIFKHKYKANIYTTENSIMFEDSGVKVGGKKTHIDIVELLYLCGLMQGISNEEFVRKMRELTDFRVTKKQYINKIIERISNNPDKINTLSRTLERFMTNIEEVSGLQRLLSRKNLIGRVISRDYGLKAGTLITEENINNLVIPSNNVVYVRAKKSAFIEECYIQGDYRVDNKALAKYNKKDIKVSSLKEIDNNYYITDGTAITPQIIDILVNSGVTFVAKKGKQNQVTMSSLTLDTPITLSAVNESNPFDILYSILTTYLLVLSNDKQTIYNIMNLDSSFNKAVVTPMEITKELSGDAFRNSLAKQVQNMRIFLEKYRGEEELLLRDIWEQDGTNPLGYHEIMENPLAKAFNSEFAEMRGRLVADNYCETLSANALVNPVHYVYNLREVSTNISDENAIDFEQRQLHVAMLGRFDIFEVPMSKKLGITTSLASGCNIGYNGELFVKYRKVINGTISNETVRLEAIDERNYIILSMTDVDIDDNGKLINLDKPVFAKVKNELNFYESNIALVMLKDIIYNDNVLISMTPYDEISWSVACIPFISNNDSARVTYGISQLKQSKVVINAEKPLVQTPAWNQIAKMQLPFNTQNTITERNFAVPAAMQSQHSLNIKYHNEHYSQDEANVRMESVMIEDDTLKIGVNALVAFLPDGYNYEDAVHVSYDFANRMSSLKVDDNDIGKVVRDKLINKKGESEIRRVSIQNIKVTPTNVHLAANSVVVSAGDKLVEITQQGKIKPYTYKDDLAGYLLSWRKVTGIEYGDNCFSIEYKVLKSNSLSAGDKLSNRHGNKGVLAFPHSLEDNGEYGASPNLNYKLPKLSNNKQIDVLYNPLGVMSRMNLGQIYEAQLGLVAKVLNVRIEVNSVAEINQDEISKWVSFASRLANSKDNFDSILSELDNEELKEYLKDNEYRIKIWEGVFDENGMAYLEDPEIGKIRKKVLIGYIYISKLIQETESKVASRGSLLSVGSGGYETMEGQPTHGRVVSGGERYGNMELDALMAYGADKYVSNALNERCNNISARYKSLSKLLHIDQPKQSFGIRRSSQHFIMLMKIFGVDITSDTTNNDISKVQTMQYVNPIKTKFSYGNDEHFVDDTAYSTVNDELLTPDIQIPTMNTVEQMQNITQENKPNNDYEIPGLSAVEKMQNVANGNKTANDNYEIPGLSAVEKMQNVGKKSTAQQVADKYGINSKEYQEWSMNHAPEEGEKPVAPFSIDDLPDAPTVGSLDDFDNISL